MVALLALASIAGGLFASLLGFPVIGPWALLLAPLGGSVTVVAIGLAAGPAARQRSRDEAIDEMVSELRSVLPRMEAAQAPASRQASDETAPRRRAMG